MRVQHINNWRFFSIMELHDEDIEKRRRIEQMQIK